MAEVARYASPEVWLELPLKSHRVSAGLRLWLWSWVTWLGAYALWMWCLVRYERQPWNNLHFPPRNWFWPAGPFELALQLRPLPPLYDLDAKSYLGGGILAVSWLAFFFACWNLGLPLRRGVTRVLAGIVRWGVPILIVAGIICVWLKT